MDLEPELNSCGDMPKDMITNLGSKWLRNSQGLLSDGGVRRTFCSLKRNLGALLPQSQGQENRK